MTHYDVLGVPPTATAAEVRQAYVALARVHHPDRAGGDANRMRAVNDAWATLGDPGRRARYDLTLPGPSRSTAVPDEPVVVHRDADDLLADLDDDTPFGAQVVLGRWVSMVPVAVFAASVVVGVGGTLFSSTPALGAALGLFVLSCALFLAAPFVALLSSRRPNR